jgi:hypothetical protein
MQHDGSHLYQGNAIVHGSRACARASIHADCGSLVVGDYFVRALCWPATILHHKLVQPDQPHREGSCTLSLHIVRRVQGLSEGVPLKEYGSTLPALAGCTCNNLEIGVKSTRLQGLLNKKPENRLDWPDLLSHPFVKESEEERLVREQRLVTAAARAEASMAWRGEGGAIAGAAVYAGLKFLTCDRCLAMQSVLGQVYLQQPFHPTVMSA